MFLGTYTPKLDDKGRLTLPAKFRDDLAGGLMVTKGQDHSLAVYPREEFTARARKAAAVSRTNPEARAFIRNLAASADEQRPDSQGRITLSAAHREYAGLTKECVVIGSVDFLEIWDAQAWERYQSETEASFSTADGEFLGDLL
ncbi:division/cell wall cluster transcriptional repressor MraZ [Corynebacterium sp. 153RC1]|uniref:division/cell wall cluster transcriptional repressor MraZ n=1 Tax=Corynebacterium TaxID=1716 RepID=UPI00211CE50E|nr:MULTISPECIES: division/cell wall cluster transcriptional repressor MraZ [unclassified Corynebacterium]MCQ9369809.1 division/cell wall cluster transcriptional repressor MraZ [Corynebacterium sp. 35RC1]MCQ9342277.1 division/cell wall cluster transcriptional repressor MraZ [Corynebacterium sp. 76QC2CO]MCQ9352255.1 division/cell wall cluster transcriptional repressor MraZ [Corynebacterium sp. 209RC1]MCQ9355441.1 division/cell wall cluster transcriptional repressor MraZ [Corynebacterium sp. 1222R